MKADMNFRENAVSIFLNAEHIKVLSKYYKDAFVDNMVYLPYTKCRK